MLKTPVCDLLGITIPIIQAGMGPFTSAELTAAVSNAGGLGSIGAGTRTRESLSAEIDRVRRLSDRPFAINHTISNLDEDAFQVTLAAAPRVVSFALGDPRGLVDRVHAIGALVMLQVTTVQQARLAVERGVDLVVAQGGEAGGFGGFIGTMTLVPQVVDVVGPIPVFAAGGIADGRGLAAALCLGAQGINIGTRFLASTESLLHPAWQRAIVTAASEEATKVDVFAEFFAELGGEYGAVPRTLPSDFVRSLHDHATDVSTNAARLRQEVITAAREQRLYDLLPFAGQTVGLIEEVLPAAEIVSAIAQQARQILASVHMPQTRGTSVTNA